MRAAMRAAAMTLLEGYKAANNGSIEQVFEARPLTIHPPSAFIDSIDEPDISYTPAGTQRTPNLRIRLVRGTFASGPVANLNDDLVDGFIEYVVTNRHAAGANTLALISSVEDDDGWIPEWMPAETQRPFYSTLVTLAGEGLFGGIT